MRHRRELRFAGTVVLVALLVAGPARPAGAHAALVSSNPEPGERLASAPGVVLLQFGEPLVERLSEATVVAPDGERFEGRPADGGAGKIRVPLQTNARGVYEVRWRTVSPLDGHTLEGGFRFGVGVDVEPGITGAEGTPAGSDLAIVPFRVIEDAALLMLAGASVLTLLGRREPPLAWVPVVPRVAAVVALCAGIVVVAGEALNAAGSPSLGAIGSYLTAGRGTARLARVGVEALAVALVLFRRQALVALAAGGALAALAASGHAGAVRPAWWGASVQAVHLMAAGAWAGGVLRLATLRPPGGWRGDVARELLRRFTPVALPAFAVTVAFGTLRGAEELKGVSDLWSSSYGVVLAVKVAAVGAMVPLSVRAWRRRVVLPGVEAGLGAVAVTVAALLAAFPLPPRRVAEAEAASVAAAPSPALPRPGDLTLAAGVGDTLVGLTFRPGAPGPNELYLYLSAAGEGGASPAVEATVNTTRVRFEPCGSGCRKGRVDLEGGEHIGLRVPGAEEVLSAVTLPALPASDGGALLGRAAERMDALRTYHVEETLGPVDPPLSSTYDFEAPDRMDFRLISTGQENVRIGRRLFSRSSSAAPWEVSEASAIDTREFIWEQPRQRAVRIVGAEEVDGAATDIVALFAVTTGGTPLWFRLWVDGDGLVRRALMLAEGHFMEHRYSAFDEPVTIEPPTGPAAQP